MEDGEAVAAGVSSLVDLISDEVTQAIRAAGSNEGPPEKPKNVTEGARNPGNAPGTSRVFIQLKHSLTYLIYKSHLSTMKFLLASKSTTES